MGVRHHRGDAVEPQSVEPEYRATIAFQRQALLRIFVSAHKWKYGEPTEEEALMMRGG
jgi:hypothetical protein